MHLLQRIFPGLFRFTDRDPELRAYLQRKMEEDTRIEQRIQEIAKATLDSEDTWLRDVAIRDPMCFVDAAAKCSKG